MSYITEMQITVEGENSVKTLTKLCPDADPPSDYADRVEAASCYYTGNAEEIKAKAHELSGKTNTSIIILGRGGMFEDVWAVKYINGKKDYEYNFAQLIEQQKKLKKLLYGILN